MKMIATATALASVLLATPALAGVNVEIRFAAPPPVVVISPGVEIVEDNDEEIFFSSGYYWVVRDDVWYQTSDYHGGWRVVRSPRVPVFIRDSPRGHYRHWKHEEKHEEKRDAKHEEKHEEHHEEKHEHKHGGDKH